MIDKRNLVQAVLEVGCSKSQAESIWKLLNQGKSLGRRFTLFNTFWYLGGLIILCSLALFLRKGYELYGATCLFSISLGYVLTFYAVGIYLWKIKRKEVLGGIAFFLSLSFIPLVIYAFQVMLEWWSGNDPGQYVNFFELIHNGWLLMGVFTLIPTMITLRYFRFPLLTVIFYLALWLISQDVLPFFMRFLNPGIQMESIHTVINIVVGCSIILRAFLLDRKNKKNDAFWGYLLGVSIFWIGISLADYNTEWGYFAYCSLNVLLVILGPLINRKIFVIFGIFGILTYLVELVFRHFSTSPAFPIILSVVGLAVIVIGILFQSYRKKLSLVLSHLRKR